VITYQVTSIRQTDRQTDTHTHTNRQTDTHTHKQTPQKAILASNSTGGVQVTGSVKVRNAQKDAEAETK